MTQSLSTKDFVKGLATRKQVMGEDFVANAFGNATPFTQPLQEVLLHASIYCGLPAAVDAFRTASQVVDGTGKNPAVA